MVRVSARKIRRRREVLRWSRSRILCDRGESEGNSADICYREAKKGTG